MQVSEFRSHAETLGRFASVREKAEAPSDRILVQARDGVLKLVAGTENRTVVVNCGPHPGSGMALVPARMLLTAAKSLRGKGTVEFEVNPDGAVLRTSMGGVVKMSNVDNEVPAWLRPVPGGSSAVIPANFWPDASKVLTTVLSWAVSGWKQVGLDVTPFGTYLRAADAYTMTTVLATEVGLPTFYGAIDPEFIGAIRDFEDEGEMRWTQDYLTVESGPYLAVTKFLWHEPKLPYPPEDVLRWDVKVEADRARLVEMVKGVASSEDEFRRVTLVTTSDDRLTVSAWGGGQSVSLPATVSGVGRVAMVSERLLKLLTAVGGKTVTLQWGEGPGVCITGDRVPWSVFQSRVALT